MLFTYPLDVVRVRLATNMISKEADIVYKGILGYLKLILKNEGFFGIYKGFLVTCIGLVPYCTVSFVSYDYLR